MGKYTWESNDAEFAEFYQASASETGEAGFVNPLPYRFYTLRKQDASNKWSANVQRTVYRFFGDIRSVSKPLSNGKEYITVKCDGTTWRQQFMLGLWNDFADLESTTIPFYLRDIPVPGWTPLSKAIGLMKKGKPDPFLIAKGNDRPKYHQVNGVPPVVHYWAGVHVTQFVTIPRTPEEEAENKPQKYEVAESTGILLLKNWQVTELLKAVDNWREFAGPSWDVTGFPIHLLNLDLPRPQTGLKVSKGGTYRPEDAEVYDMSQYDQPDFNTQAEAVLEELDNFLTESGSPIKGWPFPDSNPDGWHSERPLVAVQREMLESGHAANDLGGLEVFESEKPNERWTGTTDDDLLVIAEEYGVKIPVRNRTREKLIAAIEKAQAKL